MSSAYKDHQFLGLIQAISASTWNKQTKYDAYIEATYGGYGIPVLTEKKATTPEKKIIADIQKEAPLAPSTEKCDPITEDLKKVDEGKNLEKEVTATCPMQLTTCPVMPAVPTPPPLPGTAAKQLSKDQVDKARAELNKFDEPVVMPTQADVEKMKTDKALKTREQLGRPSYDDLLNQIRKGAALKPVATGESTDKKRVEPPAGGLGDALSQALEKRRKFIAPKADKTVGYGSLQEEEQNWED